jgi:ABC-2 type transport system permease protein
MRIDLATIVWKEWRSLASGRSRRQIALIGGVLGIEALIFPIQMGRDWVTDPVMSMLLGVIMPLILVGVIIPDAVAGERERHTLATLLASRLPDRAILFGKLGFAVVVGWLTAPVMLLGSMVVANLSAGTGDFAFYDWRMLAVTLTAGLLVAVLTGAVGFFVSLRAATAQEAQQMTVMSLMLPAFLLGAVLMVVGGNPDLRGPLLDLIETLDWTVIAAAALGVLAVVDVLLVRAADRRFRRGRLLSL